MGKSDVQYSGNMVKQVDVVIVVDLTHIFCLCVLRSREKLHYSVDGADALLSVCGSLSRYIVRLRRMRGSIPYVETILSIIKTTD
jgi:hypothetical protein